MNRGGVTLIQPHFPFEQLQPLVLNNTRYCDQFPGADAGFKILNCIADLPAAGGIADARGLTGAQTISVNPFGGSAKPLVLLLGNATFSTSACLFINDDGSTPPKRPRVSIVGVGYDAASITAGKTPTSGTIIDSSCSAAPAKLDTRAAAVLEISGITFMDSSGGTLPFIQTTNTILLLHDNQFFGSKNGTLCDQDAVVLGGTTNVIDGTANGAFQGYGTTIHNNFFNHIRRAVYGRTFVNDVPIFQNTVWVQSGSNLAGGAAFEFVGGVSTNTGNQVRDNLIEVTNYPYGIKFSGNGFNNTIAGNGCYDPTGTHLACTRFENSSQFNLVEDGYRNDTYAGISEDAGSLATNTFLTAHQLQFSNYTQPIRFTSPGAGLPVAAVRQEVGSVNVPMWNSRITTTNDEFYWGINTAGQPQYGLWMYPAGGTGETLVSFRRYDSTQRGVFINASATGFFECAADCRVRAFGGSTLWLGTNTNNNAILINDTSTKFNKSIDNSGTGLKHVRSATTCTTAAAIGATCTTASISWSGTAFADTSYTLTCSFSGAVTNLPAILTTTRSAASFTVTIMAETAAAASYSEIDCHAFHD